MDKNNILEKFANVQTVADLEDAYNYTMHLLKEELAINMRQIAVAKYFDSIFTEAAKTDNRISLNETRDLIKTLEDNQKEIYITFDKLEELHRDILKGIKI